jgi:hypothetical protein
MCTVHAEYISCREVYIRGKTAGGRAIPVHQPVKLSKHRDATFSTVNLNIPLPIFLTKLRSIHNIPKIKQKQQPVKLSRGHRAPGTHHRMQKRADSAILEVEPHSDIQPRIQQNLSPLRKAITQSAHQGCGRAKHLPRALKRRAYNQRTCIIEEMTQYVLRCPADAVC